ncbi:MAG TPA: BON domain-containing protein [Gemmatimonadaceae bacterium]|nr:BON domain-containing protein [Gemmatimonadaceae bacterium]
MSLRVREAKEDSGRPAAISAVAGVIAGFALGMLFAKGLGDHKRAAGAARDETRSDGTAADREDDEFGDAAGDDFGDDDEVLGENYDDALEERVLEVFQNDPVLSKRAIDIASLGDQVIELAGRVDTAREATHAVAVARGVPDVVNVVNRLAVRRAEKASRRAEPEREVPRAEHVE